MPADDGPENEMPTDEMPTDEMPRGEALAAGGLAAGLHDARARLAAAARDLPAADAARLQRQFIAVCDAAKAPGADAAAGLRRLAKFLAALDSVIAGKS
jgi:hypothetical protein